MKYILMMSGTKAGVAGITPGRRAIGTPICKPWVPS